jgi:hypothetical protein
MACFQLHLKGIFSSWNEHEDQPIKHLFTCHVCKPFQVTAHITVCSVLLLIKSYYTLYMFHVSLMILQTVNGKHRLETRVRLPLTGTARASATLWRG